MKNTRKRWYLNNQQYIEIKHRGNLAFRKIIVAINKCHGINLNIEQFNNFVNIITNNTLTELTKKSPIRIGRKIYLYVRDNRAYFAHVITKRYKPLKWKSWFRFDIETWNLIVDVCKNIASRRYVSNEPPRQNFIKSSKSQTQRKKQSQTQAR